MRKIILIGTHKPPNYGTLTDCFYDVDAEFINYDDIIEILEKKNGDTKKELSNITSWFWTGWRNGFDNKEDENIKMKYLVPSPRVCECRSITIDNPSQEQFRKINIMSGSGFLKAIGVDLFYFDTNEDKLSIEMAKSILHVLLDTAGLEVTKTA